MMVALDINANDLVALVQQEFNRVKVPCQAAMAKEFHRIVIANFEQDGGEDRPEEWEKLRYMYAEAVHGGDRTPRLQLSGDLLASIDIGDTEMDAASVFTYNPYASFHQNGGVSEFGGKSYNIPARPFFPIVGEEVTPYTTDKCVAACEEKLTELLK